MESALSTVQVRGFVAEKVIISTATDPYLGLKALSAYSGLSIRTLRTYIDRLPDEALPCYRVGTKILVRRSEFDEWIAAYRAVGRPSLSRALRDLGIR
jgi:hypothetical protein